MGKAVEIIEKFINGMNHPNEIFQMYEELSELPRSEVQEAVRKTKIGDAISMSYIAAVEMKAKGIWDEYVAKWETDRYKTGRERLEEYAKEREIPCMKFER